MKSYRFTIKVREEHKPKEFKEGVGRGVLYIKEVDFKISDEDAEQPMFTVNLLGYASKLLNEIMTVKIEEI
jgi:hypothetical protein